MFLSGLVATAACAEPAASMDDSAPVEVTILVDESLRVPLVRLARDYTSRTHTSVTLWFANAAGMIETIREGADADIVITADDDALLSLEHSGQIDVYATQAIVSSPLVIAQPDTLPPLRRDASLDLMNWRYRKDQPLRIVAIETPHSVVQRLSAQALSGSELLSGPQRETVAATSADDAVRRMQHEQVPGLLLAVDVFSRPGVHVLQRFPENVAPPAVFKAAVLAGVRMPASRRFVEVLQSDASMALFAQYGLSSAAQAAERPAGARFDGKRIGQAKPEAL